MGHEPIQLVALLLAFDLCLYVPSLVSMGKLVRGACGKVSANFDLYSVLLTFPWALLLSFLFFYKGEFAMEPEPKYEIDATVSQALITTLSANRINSHPSISLGYMLGGSGRAPPNRPE